VSAHRFKLELAGQTVYGLAFATEAELDQFCAARGPEVAAPADPPTHEPHRRGRPSFAVMLEAAAKTLRRKLSRCDSLSARARLVLRHLAQTLDAEDLPAASTVRAFLAERPIAKKIAEKSAEKSERAKIHRIGGA
jgi:hypothetical protein